VNHRCTRTIAQTPSIPSREGSGVAIRRSGFTMVEVLLVLALVAVIAALAWPVLQKPFANRRLHTAADVVRTEFCQARVDAMRSGHTFTFRYAPDSDRFCTSPENDPSGTDLPDSDPDFAASGDEDTFGPVDEVPQQPVEKTLPEGVKFVATENAADALAVPDDPESITDVSDGWSSPIFFYPDGTTSDARLMLANDSGYAIELTLRGVTGTVAVGDIIAARE
jgi:prepilin-type N-terminal cleavage/methylation domain-containing protein